MAKKIIKSIIIGPRNIGGGYIPDTLPIEVEDHIKGIEAELMSLKKFARKVIGSYCWEYDSMDGLDIQELAEVLGLLEQHTATEDDVDDESDFEVGDMIYKFSEILKE